MRCEVCDQGERVPVRRAKLTERGGRVALVLAVPMEECLACGERWLDFGVARRLDELITAMLVSDAEIVTRHYDAPDTTAASADERFNPQTRQERRSRRADMCGFERRASERSVPRVLHARRSLRTRF